MVVVHCDNQAAVCVVNAGYSRDKDMMHLMHCLFLSGHTGELAYGHNTFWENRMSWQTQSHVVTSPKMAGMPQLEYVAKGLHKKTVGRQK